MGNYRDFPFDAYAFLHQQSITANTVDVQNAINAWALGNGGDGSEGQFVALDQLAQPPGGSIGWRPGSNRFIVWFGDAPAHDPVCKGISGLAADITEASVTAKLKSEKIAALAISVTTGFPNGLDDNPTTSAGDYAGPCGAPGGASGQATRIAAATGGVHIAGINPATVVTTIIDVLKAALAIKNVTLVASGEIIPFVTSITPAAGYGPLPVDKESVLRFQVTFDGSAGECTTRDKVFTGALNVIADGVRVAAKPTRITVPACLYSYAVKIVCGTQAHCDCECGPLRPGVYSTEVNILNPKCRDASLTKKVVPMVFGGAAAGREPRIVRERATEKMRLPSGAATMDDCCRIAEMLYGGPPVSTMPLTVGFLHIVSDQELHVTAVYTVSDLKGNGVSIDVENVPHKLT